jgi:hypothetical protein
MPHSKAVSNKDVLIPIATFMNESNELIIATWPKMMICFQARDFNNYFSLNTIYLQGNIQNLQSLINELDQWFPTGVP